MTWVASRYLIEVDGVTVARGTLGRSVSVDRGTHRFNITLADQPIWEEIGPTISPGQAPAMDPDERSYLPRKAFLESRQSSHVTVRILEVVVNRQSELSASTYDPKDQGHEREVQTLFMEMWSLGLDAAREFCDLVRLRGQPWMEPSGRYPRVINMPELWDMEAKKGFSFRIGRALEPILFVDDSGVLGVTALNDLQIQMRSSSGTEVGERLVSEALYLVQSEQPTGPRQATLLAAMGVEVHTKFSLRRVADSAELPWVDVLLSNPKDWSLSAHALFQKALPLACASDLGPMHVSLSKRVQRLFTARNAVAHRGESIDPTEASTHVATAKEALVFLNDLPGMGAPALSEPSGTAALPSDPQH